MSTGCKELHSLEAQGCNPVFQLLSSTSQKQQQTAELIMQFTGFVVIYWAGHLGLSAVKRQKVRPELYCGVHVSFQPRRWFDNGIGTSVTTFKTTSIASSQNLGVKQI